MNAPHPVEPAVNLAPTPTAPDRPVRWGDFATICEALDYAALQPTGINLYSLRGKLAEVLPYRLLRGQALGLAGWMRNAGLAPGDRIGLAATTDGDFLRAFFACQYAGLTPVPLPLPAPFGGREAFVGHVRRMLQACRAAAVFASDEVAPWFTEAGEGLDLRALGALPVLPEDAPPPEPPPRDRDGLAFLQFSSGSTRFPMGVEVTQASLIANASATAVHGLASTASDRALSWLPLYHDMGLVGFLLMPMLMQMSIDLMPTNAFVRRPVLWPELIAANRATLSYSPTFGYDLAARRVDAEALARLDLSHWRVAGVGGDMVRPEPLRRFAATFAPAGFDARAFTPSYGMAEATLAVSMTAGAGLRTDRGEVNGDVREFALCGRPLPGHALEIRRPDGEAAREHEVGHVFIKGPSLMRGYFDRPQDTARVLDAAGWLDTGDLGYRIGEELVVTGRAKDLIIVNGRNLWPQDLEWTLEDGVPELRTGDVAVFSVTRDGEERIVALVERRGRDEEELRGRIGELARSHFGVIVDIVMVKARSLPVTSSGKLSRSKARELYEAGTFDAVAPGDG